MRGYIKINPLTGQKKVIAFLACEVNLKFNFTSRLQGAKAHTMVYVMALAAGQGPGLARDASDLN